MKTRYLQAAVLACPLTVAAAPVALDDIVVTETRTAQAATDALASVTVIDRDRIDALQARSLADVLRGLPGVSLANAGGAGKLTSLFLRGTESDHVLVLLDGVRVNSPAFGGAPLQDIPVGQIERIEIVRGPRSSLYGPEAVGGVIQIFTRAASEAPRITGQVGGGSYGSTNADVGISGTTRGLRYSATLAGSDTAGFNACSGDPDIGGGCFKFEPDDDGYSNLSGGLKFGFDLGSTAGVELHALRTDARVDYDGDFGNSTDTVQQVLGARLRADVYSGWRVSLAAGQSRDESDTKQDGEFFSSIDTRIDTASLQNDIQIGARHLLSLGADYMDARVGGTTEYDQTSRDDVGVFGQYQGDFGRHDLQASLRWDDDEAFGEHATGALGWGYRIADVQVTASAGTSFKAPSFNELYFPGFSNPDLDPERAASYELGMSGRWAAMTWALNAYQTEIEDLIAFDLQTFSLDNVDRARIRGLEVVLGGTLSGLEWSSSVTVMNPENRSDGDNRGHALPRRARQSLRLDLDRALGAWQLGGSLVAAGRRYDDLGNNRSLPGYATLDLRAAYAFGTHWQLQALLVNALDKDYATTEFYNQPGRSGYLNLSWRFE